MNERCCNDDPRAEKFCKSESDVGDVETRDSFGGQWKQCAYKMIISDS